LRTKRLYLRPPRLEDAKALFPLMSDSRLTEFLAWAPHENEQVTRDTVSALINDQEEGRGYHWLVVDLSSAIVGLVSLIDVRRKHRTWIQNRAEVAYWITPASQGNGYAEEATKAMVEIAFSQLAFHKLIVYHAASNQASGRVVEKLGFEYVGIQREAFCKSGVWYDLCEYELLKSNYAMAQN
jgi:ribosomal-protein-alanine N-acetyltransferase